jgi:drug/metabolite transporter (DMT)-like permease
MGAIGYVGQALCYFTALNYASAGLVALLLYAYPTLVCLLAAAFLGERLTRGRLVLLAASFAGIALTLGGGHGTPEGIALGLAAAAFLVYTWSARERANADPLASATVVYSRRRRFLLRACFASPAFRRGGAVALGAIALVSTVIAILAFFAG